METNNQYLNNHVEKYRNVKDLWLEKFNKSHGTTSRFCKERHIHGLKRSRPWYVLLKRNFIDIENTHKPKRLNRTELLEGYVQHKLNKWERRNPCPVKKDDLFYSQQYPIWKEKRDSAEERIRDLVIARYDKLQLIGRFESTNELYKEQEIAKIKDNGDTVVHGGVNNLPESSKIIKMARKETNKIKAKRANLICTNLKDHRKKHGRILLPNVDKQMKMAA